MYASIIDMTLRLPVDEVLFDELRTDFLPKAARHSGFGGFHYVLAEQGRSVGILWYEQPEDPNGITPAGAKCQGVRGSPPGRWRRRGRGGQPSAAPRSRIVAHQLAPAGYQGEGNRSPWSLFVRQVHDGLGPSDILVVRQLANALDAKRLCQGVGNTAGQAQGGHWGVGQARELIHIRLVVWRRMGVGVLDHPCLPLLALLNLKNAAPLCEQFCAVSRWWLGGRPVRDLQDRCWRADQGPSGGRWKLV